MIRRLLEIPFFLWIFIAGGIAAKDYYEWKTSVDEPLDRDRQSKEGELALLNTRAAKIEEFKRKKAEKLAQLQQLGETFRATADRLPRSSSVPEMLKSLADIGDKSGLEVSSFRPQAPQRDQFLVITPLDIALKGTYSQAMSFLDATSHLKRVVSPQQVTMESPRRRGPVNILSVTVRLNTYHIEDTEGVTQ